MRNKPLRQKLDKRIQEAPSPLVVHLDTNRDKTPAY